MTYMDYFSNIGAPRPSTRPAASLADAPALLRQLPPHHRWGRLAAVRVPHCPSKGWAAASRSVIA
ncbi:hypothetical protein ACFQU7_39850 [Pseudoroseomonas wenyumeiae]